MSFGGAGGMGGNGRRLAFFSETSPWLVVTRRSGPPLPMVPLTLFLRLSSSVALMSGNSLSMLPLVASNW